MDAVVLNGASNFLDSWTGHDIVSLRKMLRIKTEHYNPSRRKVMLYVGRLRSG